MILTGRHSSAPHPARQVDMIKVTGRVVDEEVRPMNNVRVVAFANE
jgi:hypothetical protein